MKPYYDIDGITIYNGDCLEIMPTFLVESFDLIVADPPYNISIDIWDRLTNEKYKRLLENVSNETARILSRKGSIWVFSGWSFVDEVKTQFSRNFTLRNWIIWDRIKGRGAKNNFVSTREDILWFTKNSNSEPNKESFDYVFNKQSSNILKITGGYGQKNGNKYRTLSNVWYDIPPIVPWSKEKEEHPTQKPEQLIERIVNISSNNKDIILDPFMGSGTTLVAAKKLGRKAVGIEISEEYCKIAVERLKGLTRL